VYDIDLDTLNTKPFLAYTNPDAYQQLIRQQKRKEASFNRVSIKPELDEIFQLLGAHDSYAVNYHWKSSGAWATKTAGRGDRFPVQPFRAIDFLNVLLGEYRLGTAVALSDKQRKNITTIRIDYDFDTYSGNGVVRLTKEIQDKLASIGLDCFFFTTGNRGIQAIIPLPSPLPITVARQMWVRLKQYLSTNIATLDKCSLESFLRLPLGIHASSNNLGLFMSPETESYVSHIDQLRHFRDAWKWSMPTHIPLAVTPEFLLVQVDKGFTFIPQPAVAVVVKQSTSKLPSGDSWADKVWKMGQLLQPGQWQEYLLKNHALHASFALHGNEACTKLEELAARIPARTPSDIDDRIKTVRALWLKFNPVQPPQNSSEILALMVATRISQETHTEADALFAYIQHRKTPHTRWINENTHDFILAVLHGINCSDGRDLTITIDDLILYLHGAAISEMSRRTLVRIIQKATQEPLPIGRSYGLVSIRGLVNQLAVFRHHPGNKIFHGATPGSYSRIPGLKRKALKEIADGKSG
jgi:hypothetical protein